MRLTTFLNGCESIYFCLDMKLEGVMYATYIKTQLDVRLTS